MLTVRDLDALTQKSYDLVVVGGGVYGIMVALEAARHGLRAILLERNDFGGATSHNSLRVLHGGLRHLQSLDLPRFYAHVAERRWFFRNFPDLVSPLACLMPLHGEGLHCVPVLRAALALNDLLSVHRNRGVPENGRLSRGGILTPDAVIKAFPLVDRQGLKGGALWYDGFVADAPRLFLEVLHWACAGGATVLNYVTVRELICEAGRVVGVHAVDHEGGTDLVFRANVVVNASGPWSRRFAESCGLGARRLFAPSIAWNVVFYKPWLLSHAVAVRPRRPGAQVYFLVPWKGTLLAGTGHEPWQGEPDDLALPSDLLRSFIADLNEAVPGLDLSEQDVAKTLVGLLPAKRAGSNALASREVIIEHGASGGPAGVFSLCGVKLTTARQVAEKVLRRAFPGVRPLAPHAFPRPVRSTAQPDLPFFAVPSRELGNWEGPLRRSINEEAVHHLDDLVLRRCCLGDNPARAMALARAASALFEWEGPRAEREIAALAAALEAGCGLGRPNRQDPSPFAD